MAMEHTHLDSTMLGGASYDDEARTLVITFRSGRSYDFRNVPKDVYEGLRDASSPGQYYHQNIKGAYG